MRLGSGSQLFNPIRSRFAPEFDIAQFERDSR